ncbi:MAG: imidazolonepropionase [Myxococcales bacterium]|nr:imidazolonepropionase [Myxococcales bacterium]
MERICLTGIDWLLTCDGPARLGLTDWQQLGLRGPSKLWLERDHGSAPWLLAAISDADQPGPWAAQRTVDLGGVGVTPGWVDAHTHAVFAGDRAAEFNQRLAGRSYAEIAAEGGGILRTMAATRSASVDELVASALPRLREMAAWGTAVVEIKTGYGLDLDSEVRLLQAIGQLQTQLAGELTIIATAMPAHAIPPNHRQAPDRYVDEVCEHILPAMAQTGVPCPFVDVFVEQGYFDVTQADRIADAAQRLGMALKAHVDEFVDTGGVSWAVKRGAVSVEHLLVTGDSGIKALAGSDTVAVCLPLTSVFLREGFAPMRQLVDAGCLVALATDCNPGSAMSTNLHLAMQMAVLGGHLTPQEAVRAVTLGGAAALGGKTGPLGWSGALVVGEPCHLTALSIGGPDRLFYELGSPPRAVPIRL